MKKKTSIILKEMTIIFLAWLLSQLPLLVICIFFFGSQNKVAGATNESSISIGGLVSVSP